MAHEAVSLSRFFSSLPVITSPSATSSSVDTEEADIDEDLKDDLLEELCRKEFGFKMGKFKSNLHSQAEEQQASLDRFCAQVLSAPDPARRRELAATFMGEIVSANELAAERARHKLLKMLGTFLETAETEKDRLAKDVSKFKDEVDRLKGALHTSELAKTHIKEEGRRLKGSLQKLELEKQSIKDEARSRFEEEKALLEFSLREELQACQICLHNPRNVVIMPCLHGQFCADCLEGHQKINRTCPTCRAEIRGTLPYIA